MFWTTSKLCSWNPQLSKTNQFLFFVITEDYYALATFKNVLLEKRSLLSYVQITVSVNICKEEVIIVLIKIFWRKAPV